MTFDKLKSRKGIEKKAAPELSRGWEIKKLGEVLVKTQMVDPSKNPLDEFIYIDVSGVNKETKKIEGGNVLLGRDAPSRARKLVMTNDVIFATVRPTHSRVALITEDYDGQVCSTGYFVLRGKENIENKYLFYFLLTYEFNQQMEKLQKGASYPAVTDGEVKNIFLRYPKSPSEQQRIVSILDKAFAAIDQAKANAEQNLQNTKELFESYLQGVFDASTLSGQGQGDGWEEKKLGEVCELKPQKKEARDKLNENDSVTFLPMEDLGVLNKDIIGKKEKKLKDVSGSYTYFADNDVLLAKVTPCFENGKIGIARNLINGIGFGSSEYIVFRPKSIISSEFLYYFLSRKQIRIEGKNLMTGAVGLKRVSKDWIENYILPFPPLKTQQSIVRQLDALRAETQKLEAVYQKKMGDLEELKKSILQKAFAGELRGGEPAESETDTSASSVPVAYEINDSLSKAAEPTNNQL